MLQYGFIKYILGYNMGTFEFPTTEILVSTCILNYKTYYQFAFESFMLPSITFKLPVYLHC